jgi:hypothetical protein
MVTVVVIINLLLALLCLYGAWYLWLLRRAFAQAAEALSMAERNTHAALYGAPPAIIQGQIGVQQLRVQYHQLGPKLRQAQQALAVLGWSQSLWQRRRLPTTIARKLMRKSASQQY